MPMSLPLSAPSPVWAERAAGVALVLAVAVAGAIAARPYALTEGQLAEIAPAPVVVAAQPKPEAPITPGAAAAWTIDAAASSIRFTGTHAGKRFEGRFDKWEGHVWFDPSDLAGSKAVVLVQTASARTGDPTQEGSLQGAGMVRSGAISGRPFRGDALPIPGRRPL